MRLIITDIQWTCGGDMNEQQTAARALALLGHFLTVMNREEFLALKNWPEGKVTLVVTSERGRNDVPVCVKAARLGATTIVADDGQGNLVEVA